MDENMLMSARIIRESSEEIKIASFRIHEAVEKFGLVMGDMRQHDQDKLSQEVSLTMAKNTYKTRNMLIELKLAYTRKEISLDDFEELSSEIILNYRENTYYTNDSDMKQEIEKMEEFCSKVLNKNSSR